MLPERGRGQCVIKLFTSAEGGGQLFPGFGSGCDDLMAGRLVPAQSAPQNHIKLSFIRFLGELVLRVSLSIVVIASALAGSAVGASAQYYPPPPPGYPPPPPAYGFPPPPPPPVYIDPSAPARPLDARYGWQRHVDAGPPPVMAGDGDLIPRPPGEVYDTSTAPDITGAVRVPPPAAVAPRPGSDRAAVIAALPPDEQPEQGPVKQLPPQFRRQIVDYLTKEPAGTIIIDTPNTYLYLVLGNGKAMRYGIGVGREGFTWSGTERVMRMSEWPDWHPPKEMIDRQPYLPRFMAGGEGNPLGARALYLGNTLYRIHGTNQPSTIGTFVSSGCIRLTNEDVSDLYSRVSVGTRVVVLPGAMPASAAAPGPVAR